MEHNVQCNISNIICCRSKKDVRKQRVVYADDLTTKNQHAKKLINFLMTYNHWHQTL